MAKNKNHRIHSKNHDYLRWLAEEQRDYIGRDYQLDLANDCLIVFALPRKYKKKKDTPKKDKNERNKRNEKFERRER